jgi:hypothetical protein
VNPNLTSLVDLNPNKRLIDELVLVHLITRRRKNDDEKKKENGEFCGYHSMREVEMIG